MVEEKELEVWSLSMNASLASLITLIGLAWNQAGSISDFLQRHEITRLTLLYGKGSTRAELLTWLQSHLPMHDLTLHGERTLWTNGSLLCTLVNIVVPEACLNPYCHQDETPKHGQVLAYKYLGVQPEFSEDELNQIAFTFELETKLIKYLSKIKEAIANFTESVQNMKFCTDYIAKGMGLVTGEQNRKGIFFVYPIPKKYDLDGVHVFIKGPYGSYGRITIPAINGNYRNTDYKRAIYLSSKVNSVSPTLQGGTFLRSLSQNYGGGCEYDIQIRIKMTRTHAKVSYIPKNSGIHEISLTTNDHHLIGSPFGVPIDFPTNKYISDEDSLSDDDSDKIIVNKKYLTQIVDIMGEKMMLKENGTLEKLNNHLHETNNNNEIEIEKVNLLEGEVNLGDNKGRMKGEKRVDTNFNNVQVINKNLNESREEQQKESLMIMKDIMKNRNIESNKSNPSLKYNFIQVTDDNLKIEVEEINNHDDRRLICDNNRERTMDQATGDNTQEIITNPNRYLEFCENQNVLIPVNRKTPDILHTRQFSKKDPLREKLEGFSPPDKTNSLVNKCVNIFENKLQKTSDENYQNDPDLLTCHSKKLSSDYNSQAIKKYRNLNKKLKKLGIPYKSYDKNQRFLKSILRNDLCENFNQNEIPYAHNNNFVEKQKGLFLQDSLDMPTPTHENIYKISPEKYSIFNNEPFVQHPDKYSPKSMTLRNRFDSIRSSISAEPSQDFDLKILDGIVDNAKKELNDSTHKDCSKERVDLKFLPVGGLVKNRKSIFENNSTSAHHLLPKSLVQKKERAKDIERVPTIEDRPALQPELEESRIPTIEERIACLIKSTSKPVKDTEDKVASIQKEIATLMENNIDIEFFSTVNEEVLKNNEDDIPTVEERISSLTKFSVKDIGIEVELGNFNITEDKFATIQEEIASLSKNNMDISNEQGLFSTVNDERGLENEEDRIPTIEERIASLMNPNSVSVNGIKNKVAAVQEEIACLMENNIDFSSDECLDLSYTVNTEEEFETEGDRIPTIKERIVSFMALSEDNINTEVELEKSNIFEEEEEEYFESSQEYEFEEVAKESSAVQEEIAMPLQVITFSTSERHSFPIPKPRRNFLEKDKQSNTEEQKERFQKAKEFFKSLEDIKTVPRVEEAKNDRLLSHIVQESSKKENSSDIDVINRYYARNLYKTLSKDDFRDITDECAAVSSASLGENKEDSEETATEAVGKFQQFQNEYPHLPMTDVDDFKSRSDMTGMIPGRILMIKTHDDVYI